MGEGREGGGEEGREGETDGGMWRLQYEMGSSVSGLDLAPGGRNRSVGDEDEERSHSAPSNCTVGRRGQKR
ncbi:hypothetical protein EYF80_046350 [Liparis tanakae]|uniref:Uncharacterized protein n=1 Tax=Liparis tanakae TaxID=230148 RepID=A0A4Z2FST7_9TELE|nr:hypothetical protein EYF80_046350 [Liparis tanakae]